MVNNFVEFALKYGGEITPLIFNHENLKGGGLCNPSILVEKGEILINVRNVQYMLYHSENNQNFQSRWGPLSYIHPESENTLKTINYLGKFDLKSRKLGSVKEIDTSKLDITPKWEFIGLEDGRLVNWNNNLYLSGVRRDVKEDGEGRMELSLLKKSSEVKRTRITPPTHTYCEKNWMPILDMPYHYVKWSNPTEVVKVDVNSGKAKTVVLKNHKDFNLPRDLRGGSQVLKIGEYRIALTHEVDLFHNEAGNKDAHYYHRFVMWDLDWNIVKVSKEFKFMTGWIEFACGMVEYEDSFLITFGFQDNAAFLLEIPKDVLLEFIETGGVKEGRMPLNISNNSNLHNFIKSPYSAYNSFNLGEEYFNQDQYASALSFYLRVAEHSDDENLTYEALIKIAKCLGKHDERPYSELGAYLNAISFDPKRPEGYLLLSQYYEFHKSWLEAYNYAKMGYILANKESPTLTDIGYLGRYTLKFQIAICSWWVGRFSEARETFFDILENDLDILSEGYKLLLQTNLNSLGSGYDAFSTYNQFQHENLKFHFEGSENIKNNYSQAYQDMFVLMVLSGKRKGKYLEIGSSDPYHGSNTALLEELEWSGVSIDINEGWVEKFNKSRKNKAICADALTINYKELLSEKFEGSTIDYLQIDCEPALTSLEILKMIPLDSYKFKVITFEHDHYVDVSRTVRTESRKYLKSKGYQLLVSDISTDGKSTFEDWYINPDFISPSIIKKMLDVSPNIKSIENYMLQK